MPEKNWKLLDLNPGPLNQHDYIFALYKRRYNCEQGSEPQEYYGVILVSKLNAPLGVQLPKVYNWERSCIPSFISWRRGSNCRNFVNSGNDYFPFTTK